MLYHGNALPHLVFFIRDFSTKHNIPVSLHPCFEKIKHIFTFSVPKLRSTQKEQRFQNMPESTKKCNTRNEHARRLLTASTNGKITGITEKIKFYKQ
jgi:hypothetical protein